MEACHVIVRIASTTFMQQGSEEPKDPVSNHMRLRAPAVSQQSHMYEYSAWPDEAQLILPGSTP